MENKELIVDFDACDSIIDDLNALEQAIIEICDVVTATKVMMRKKEILKR